MKLNKTDYEAIKKFCKGKEYLTDSEIAKLLVKENYPHKQAESLRRAVSFVREMFGMRKRMKWSKEMDKVLKDYAGRGLSKLQLAVKLAHRIGAKPKYCHSLLLKYTKYGICTDSWKYGLHKTVSDKR